MEKVYYNRDSKIQDAGFKAERKVLAHSESLMVCEISFKKGGEGKLHSHVHEQASYIVSGKFEFTIDGEKFVVGPGDSLYMESGIEHGVLCLEDGVVVDIFTPERKDFLE